MSKVVLTPEEIRMVREELNMTQAEFAELLEVTPSAISQWESRSTVPSSKGAKQTLQKLKLLLGTPGVGPSVLRDLLSAGGTMALQGLLATVSIPSAGIGLGSSLGMMATAGMASTLLGPLGIATSLSGLALYQFLKKLYEPTAGKDINSSNKTAE